MGTTKRAWVGGLLVVLVAVIAACTSGGASGDPAAVVRQAMTLVETGKYDEIADLACEAKRDEIAGELGFGGALADQLPPGIEAADFAAAIQVQTDELTLGDAVRTGDKAIVHMGGSLKVVIDQAKVKELVQQFTDIPIDDALLDQIIVGMSEQLAGGVPIDEDVELVVEDGAWKIC
jgi:hypothetical protein